MINEENSDDFIIYNNLGQECQRIYMPIITEHYPLRGHDISRRFKIKSRFFMKNTFSRADFSFSLAG